MFSILNVKGAVIVKKLNSMVNDIYIFFLVI